MLAGRVRQFTESVIREMSRLALAHNAINLAQGAPDYPTPPAVIDAACKALRDGFNQYPVTWGLPTLRQAIADKAARFNRFICDPDTEITVGCGSTECMLAAFLALVEPDDEIILFQPFYENYLPNCLLTGARPKWVSLRPPDWSFDPEELTSAFGPRTRAIIVNTPANPTGKVFRKNELELIASLCQRHDTLAFTDEIYEHLIHIDEPHLSLASLPGMFERTVTVSGLSKTYSVTGWRLGWCVAPAPMAEGIRKVHDFLTIAAPHPLQHAAAVALRLPDSYYQEMLAEYGRRKDLLCGFLASAGFTFAPPQGAYYVMTDAAAFGDANDLAFVTRMTREVGVTAVPCSSFHVPVESGRTKVRFMFAKKPEVLTEAGERLARLRPVN